MEVLLLAPLGIYAGIVIFDLNKRRSLVALVLSGSCGRRTDEKESQEACAGEIPCPGAEAAGGMQGDSA